MDNSQPEETLKDEGHNSSLDSYLVEAQQAGAVEGSGHFTYDPQKALQKISKFSLPEPGLWIVKIVQAAVASGAPRFSCIFQRKRVHLNFSNTSNWTASELAGIILNYSSNERAVKHLSLGILSALGDENEEIVWTCGGQRCRLSADNLEIEDAPDDGDFHLFAQRSRRKSSLSDKANLPFRYVIKQTAYEYKALVERACHCPIEIDVDKYQLPRSYMRPGNRLNLAVWPLTGLGHPCRMTYRIRKRPISAKDSFTTHYSPTEDKFCEAVLNISRVRDTPRSTSKNDNLIYTMQDGILLEKKTG